MTVYSEAPAGAVLRRSATLSPPRERSPVSAEADFDEFYEVHAPGLVRQLHAYTGNFSEAQDCVQEAYARAWQRWPVISGYEEPGAWVRTVAIRIAINRFRRARNLLAAYARHGVAGPA